MKGLKLSIEKHGVDILAFQEAMPKYIVPVLKENLGKTWKIIADDFGIVTCYRKDKLHLEKTSSDRGSRIRSLTLKVDSNPEILIDFHNIWGVFDQLPLMLENQCREALEGTNSDITIILGDTNSRLAPLDDEVRNITTGAIPLMFNKDNGVVEGKQLPDYPDGGFYRDKNGIHQLAIRVLDFASGNIFRDERTEPEVGAWPEYRMVMCLDDQFNRRPIINNQTVFEYEDFLRDEFGHADILVRVSSDCLNHKAIGIAFPIKLNKKFAFIQDYLKSDPEFQFRELSATNSKNNYLDYDCVFAPRDKIHLLHEAISAYLFQEKHPILAGINDFFTTPSWKRDAFIGAAAGIIAIAITLIIISLTMGIGAIPVLFLGSTLAASLGGILSIMGLFTGVAVGVGFFIRDTDEYQLDQLDSLPSELSSDSPLIEEDEDVINKLKIFSVPTESARLDGSEPDVEEEDTNSKNHKSKI